jgi:hypothetical protein
MHKCFAILNLLPIVRINHDLDFSNGTAIKLQLTISIINAIVICNLFISVLLSYFTIPIGRNMATSQPSFMAIKMLKI